jgi:hypothetical protein
MPRNLYVPIAQKSLDDLHEIAKRERRRPQDQAAILLEQAINVASASDRPGAPRTDSTNRRTVADSEGAH